LNTFFLKQEEFWGYNRKTEQWVCEEQGWDKEQGGGMDQKGVLKKNYFHNSQ
jgi:hypothetical protein